MATAAGAAEFGKRSTLRLDSTGKVSDFRAAGWQGMILLKTPQGLEPAANFKVGHDQTVGDRTFRVVKACKHMDGYASIAVLGVVGVLFLGLPTWMVWTSPSMAGVNQATKIGLAVGTGISGGALVFGIILCWKMGSKHYVCLEELKYQVGTHDQSRIMATMATIEGMWVRGRDLEELPART